MARNELLNLDMLFYVYVDSTVKYDISAGETAKIEQFPHKEWRNRNRLIAEGESVSAIFLVVNFC